MERIFYKTNSFDSESGLPIYIFDTSYLPPTDAINYDEFIPTLMKSLPQEEYVLIMFSCGLNKISWLWGIKFLKSFLTDNNENHLDKLFKIITIHDSWFVKSMTQIFKNYNITKKNFGVLNKMVDSFDISKETFGGLLTQSSTIIHYSTLSDLSKHLDITKLKISLNVYKYNYEIEDELTIPQAPRLINEDTKINFDLNPSFYHHFYQIFNILNTYGANCELIFHKPGNKLNSDIFFNCVNRNQVLWINDWDLYCISTTFKRILMELSQPLISIHSITLPIKDDEEFTKENFDKIINSFEHNSNYHIVLLQLCELCYSIINNSKVTRHSSSSLSKCLCYCLSHELISLQNKDNILIINRFFKNVLDNWEKIRAFYKGKFPTISEIIYGHSGDDEIMDSYDMSYDLTLEEEKEEDRVLFNTNNILTTNRRLSYMSPSRQLHTPTSSPRKQTPTASPTRRLPAPKYCGKSPEKVSRKPLEDLQNKENASDVPNISIQYPPQKYKFQVEKATEIVNNEIELSPNNNNKKTVIRGRKVGELARLFEERAKGLELLKEM